MCPVWRWGFRGFAARGSLVLFPVKTPTLHRTTPPVLNSHTPPSSPSILRHGSFCQRISMWGYSQGKERDVSLSCISPRYSCRVDIKIRTSITGVLSFLFWESLLLSEGVCIDVKEVGPPIVQTILKGLSIVLADSLKIMASVWPQIYTHVARIQCGEWVD